MKIYLSRHAKTLSHERSRRQTPNSYLGPIGKTQAEQIADRISKEKIDIIFSSPWLRTKQTALHISKKIKTPVRYMDDIKEITYSAKLFDPKRDKKLDQQFEKERLANIFDMDWRFDKTGESRRDLIARARRFQKFLLKNFLGQTVLVITHGIFLKAFIASCLLGEKEDDKLSTAIFQIIRCEYTGLTSIEYLEEDKVWKINYLNDHSHLQ